MYSAGKVHCDEDDSSPFTVVGVFTTLRAPADAQVKVPYEIIRSRAGEVDLAGFGEGHEYLDACD